MSTVDEERKVLRPPPTSTRQRKSHDQLPRSLFLRRVGYTNITTQTFDFYFIGVTTFSSKTATNF